MGARCEPVGRPVLRVLLVDNSEADELEDTPQAPSRPKPRPAYKGATGLGTLANQPSTSSPNIAGSPIAPAVDSTIQIPPITALVAKATSLTFVVLIPQPRAAS